MADLTPIVPLDLSTGPNPEIQDVSSISIPQASPVTYQPQQLANGVTSETPKSFMDMDLSEVMSRFAQPERTTNYDKIISTPEPITRKYPVYNAFEDNEENYAKNQSWYSKWGNGLAKMGGLAAGSFAEGLLQVPDLIAGTKDGNIWKGDWYNTIDTFTKNLEDQFPNYYTKWEQEHPLLSAIPFSGGAANFWSDKVVKNLGYTIGAIGSAALQDIAIGAVTEGIGELPLLANQVGKASLYLNKLFTGTNRLEEVLNTARTLNKSDETLLSIANMAAAAEGARIGKGVRYMTTLASSANTEAGMEARQGYEEVKKDLIDSFYKENGYNPTSDDIAKIEGFATAAGNTRYGINMALLSVSNAIQFESILKPWNSYKQGVKKGIEATVEEQAGRIGLENINPEVVSDIDRLALSTENIGKVGRIWNAIKPVVPTIFSEGIFEEGGQFATEKGVKKYFEDKYNGKINGDLKDIIANVGYGLAQEFGTTEGIENILLGSITGALFHPLSSKYETYQRNKAGVLSPEEASQVALNNLNAQGVTGLFANNYDSAAQSLKHKEDISQAVQDKNIFAFKNLKADEFFNFIKSGLQNNRYDVRTLQLEMLKELPNEELNKLFQIPDGTRESNHAYIDELIGKAQVIKKSHDAVANVFENPYQYRGNPQSEAHTNENKAWFAFEDYKSALVKMSYNMTDFNQRLGSIQSNISQINFALTNDLISKLTDPSQLNELKVDYKSKANELSEQLNTTIKRSENPTLYNKTKEQIKAYETNAEAISNFLNKRDENELPKLFNKLSNFEVNGQDPTIASTIDPVNNTDLINYGHDINQIQKGRDLASSTYDYLFTQEGYEDFIKNHEEWLNGLAFDNTNPKQESKAKEIEINGVPYEVDRQYKTNIEGRYTVPVGTTDLKNPQGVVVDTFKSKEEAELARDTENINIETKLDEITFLSYEKGRVLVRDSKGDIQYLDPTLLDKFTKLKSEEEIVAENANFYEDLDNTLAKETNTAPDLSSGEDTNENTEAEIKSREAAKKAKEIVNRSTTSNSNSTKEYYKLQKRFFSKFDTFKKDVKDNARVIFVHKNNQEALGLNGLVEKMLEGGYGAVYDINDPKLTPVLAIFVKQNKDKFEYLDSEGNILSNDNQFALNQLEENLQDRINDFINKGASVNDAKNLAWNEFPEADKKAIEKLRISQIDINNLIIGTMPIAKEQYLSGEESPWRNDTSKEYIKADNEAWQKQREIILANNSANPEMYNFNISRGFPEVELDAENNIKYNSAVGTLIKHSDLSKGNLLQVSNGKFVTPNNETLNIPSGKLVLINGNTVEKLNNRKFTENEVNNVYNLLKKFVTEAKATGHFNKEILTYFRGIMYWREVKEGSTIGNSQVYLNKGILNIGKYSTPFTSKAILDNQEAIKEAFSNIFVNANNKYVQNNTPFRELSINDNGDINAITWNSYQHYLLSNKYDIEETENELSGKTRSDLEIPFKTPVRPINGTVPNDSNYIGKYAVIGNSVSENAPLFNTIIKQEVKSASKTKTEETPITVNTPVETKSTGIQFNGKTVNTYKTSIGDLRFSVTKNKAGNNAIAIVSDGNYKKYITSLLTNPTEDFISYLEYFNEETPTKALAEDYLLEQVDNYITNSNIQEENPVTTVANEEKIQEQVKEISKEEVTKPSDKTNIAPGDINSLDLGDWNEEAFRTVLNSMNYTEHNLAKSEAWFKENIPVDSRRLNHLIKVTGGGYAWGSYFNKVASWYKNAKLGTIEHEGFEAIWGDFATLKERKEVLKEFNARTGSFISSETGKAITYSKATEHEAKEQLAEELGNYVLNNELYSEPKQGQNAIYRFFKKFVDFIKSMLGIDQSKIKQMFDKINTGYYKTSAYISEANNNGAEYSILNLTESDSYNIVRGLTYNIMGELFANNRNLIEFDEIGSEHAVKDLYNKVLKNVENLFTVKVPQLLKAGRINEVQFANFTKIWDSIKADNKNVNALVEEYLKTFSIVADLSGESILDLDIEKDPNKEAENTEYAANNPEGYLVNSFKVDAKKNASNSVKLLMATLPETTYIDPIDKTKGTKPVLDTATLMPKMANYSKTFNFLLNQLWDVNTWDEKEQRLMDLAKDYPNYVSLNKRLKIGQANVDLDTWNLRTKFFNVMSKQRPDAYIHFIGKDEEGKSGSRVRAINTNALVKSKAQEWLDTLKLAVSSPNNIVQIDKDNQYEFNGSKIASNPLKTAIDKLQYLNDLNIPFTNQIYNKLSESDKTEFSKAVLNLNNSLKNKNKVIDITPSTLNSAGNFNKIAALYLRGNEDSTSTFSNIDGEKQQQFVGNNFISNLTNDINGSKDKDDLIQRLPFITEDYRSDSVYLNKFLFTEEGEKTGKSIEIGYNQGLVNSEADEETPISKMIAPVRLLEQINMNLKKNYYMLVPADAQTEWMLKMEHIVPFDRFANNDVNDVIYRTFNNYYKTEKRIATDTQGQIKLDKNEQSIYKSTMYHKDFNSNYSTVDLNKDKFINYIDTNVTSIIKYLKDNNVITSNKNTPDKFILKGLDDEFLATNHLGKSFTEAELTQLFKFTETNYMINHIEMHKMYFGDPSVIKDPLKRYKSFFSPRESAMYASEALNRSLNEELNKAENIELTPNDYGYWKHKEFIPTVTIKDLRTSDARTDLGDAVSIVNDKSEGVAQYADDYEITNPSDGQSWAFLPAYREILYKNGGRFSKDHEALFQYVTALDRQAMYEDGHLNDDKDSANYYKPSLKVQDTKKVAEGYKGEAQFHVIKPIGSGITLDGKIFLDKTSLAPLSYTFVRGTALEPHYLKMWKQGIGYAIMESGRKLGGQNADSLYNEDGSVNKDKYNTIVNVPHRYYGVQVETAGGHYEGPLGSQLSKLGIVNLRDNGQAQTEAIQKKIERHNEALRNITNYGYEELLKKLGIKDKSGYFTAPDKNKVAKLLKNELFRRESPQNLKDAIQVGKDGNFIIPFEAMSNYQQIKDILYSFVDKLIAKPKMHGGPKIQLAGTGFEIGGRTVKKAKKDGKDVLVSNGLKFYSATYNEQGIRTSVGRMEVLLPMFFWDKIKTSKRWKNASEADILEHLNNTKEGREVLKGIGYRIPTQELNSVEAFIIKGFIPKWMGDTIVLPEAITTKSGGDFDVDKLNTYLKNIYLDESGNIKPIPYFGFGKEARAKFDEIDIEFNGTDEEYIAQILGDDFDIYSVNKIADRMYGESLQNEYFDSLSDLILLPENYERLIRPNSADIGKALRVELETIAPNEFSSAKDKSILNRQYMSNMRHLFLIGKAWVGISASSQTNNALNQSTQIVLNPEQLDKLDDNERKWIGNANIMLPHNTTVFEGKTLPTLSKAKDKAGEFISDKISRYIDGPVDIAKDPWVTQLFQNTASFSTGLFLEKLGVPDRDVIFFLNQPIIREYNKLLNDRKTAWLYNDKNIKDILSKFGLLPQFFKNGILLNPITINSIDTKSLKGNIEKFYSGKKFTQEENEQQKTILYEYLKYSVLATHLFNFQRATSYDTNPQSEPNQQFRKTNLLVAVQTNNIWTSINSLLDNTSLGAVVDKVQKSSKAISQSYSIYNDIIRGNIEKVLSQLPSSGINFEKAARQVEESYLSYIVQTNLGTNTRIQELMLDTEKNLAKQVWELKKDLTKNHKNSDLANNKILQELISLVGNKRSEVKNITIAQKPQDVFTADVYTNAFRELRDNPITQELYSNIIDLSILQSGLGQSPIAFSKFIPYEDYSTKIADVLKNITGAPNLQEFVQTGQFFRNNWKNTDLVPNINEDFDDTLLSKYKFPRTPQWFSALKESKGITDNKYTLYKIFSKKGVANNSFITMNTYPTPIDAENETNKRTILLQRVEDETGTPIEILNTYSSGFVSDNGFYLYVPINPLGDGMKLQEYYTDIRPSVTNNAGYKIENELSMQEIVRAYANRLNTNKAQNIQENLDISENLPNIVNPEISSSEEKNSIDQQIDNMINDGEIEPQC